MPRYQTISRLDGWSVYYACVHRMTVPKKTIINYEAFMIDVIYVLRRFNNILFRERFRIKYKLCLDHWFPTCYPHPTWRQCDCKGSNSKMHSFRVWPHGSPNDLTTHTVFSLPLFKLGSSTNNLILHRVCGGISILERLKWAMPQNWSRPRLLKCERSRWENHPHAKNDIWNENHCEEMFNFENGSSRHKYVYRLIKFAVSSPNDCLGYREKSHQTVRNQ